MIFALVSVALAAVCSGTATVLQALAARRAPVSTGLDTSFVRRLVRSPAYAAALVLVAAGFALSFGALRTLPLFVVQAGRASSLAVAAVLAALVLGARLRWPEVLALVATGAGLVVLALTVAPAPAETGGTGTRVVVGAIVVAVALLGFAASRATASARAGLVLAVAAGGEFAMLAVGARTLRGLSPAVLLGDPVSWAMAVAGALGLLFTALALQRAPVVAATAVMVGVETVAGAGLGMVLAGDRPAAGAGLSTLVGFVLVLAGAVAVARFGSPDGAVAAGGGGSADGAVDLDALRGQDPGPAGGIVRELPGDRG
ncbi:hypothetical protein [Cellulomonas cellasea]|uniref:Drug/metabolite transporter (DMT)-like permease n=1 Tax=Cellulomonas cellasea TaxID=43670 RepID=A0A7W4UFM0_9CELL|nr:hypothetical protein [Cellulomonas cellasea]MBB2922909.1 drug/metabolite transporter (DMT)-like permease [Cellulomonas cellasea]